MKSRHAISASALALAVSMGATNAFAQGAVSVLTDEILVTATKKANAENVQDVPLSVTAYGADQLDALQVRDLQSLTYSVPNVQFDDIGTTPGVANFSIRGLGVNSSIPSIDPTVGVFVDGMYLGINQGVLFEQFDIESIEILRGPQGVLFGRNVTGGAVLINTKDAPETFTADFKAAVESGLRGTGNNYRVMGSVGGPLIEDTVLAKVAVFYNNDRGWFERYTGPLGPAPLGLPSVQPRTNEFVNHGLSETLLIRPSLVVRPSDQLEINIKFEHGESDGDGPAAQNHVAGNGLPNPLFSAPRDSFDFSIDEPGFYDSKWDQVVIETNLDVGFGDGTITNIFSWRNFQGQSLGDIDALPFFGFHSSADTYQDQISNELRYNGAFGRADVTAGLYYFSQDISYDEQRFILGGLQRNSGGGFQEQYTLGAFFNVDYSLTDSLVFQVGARLTYEDKEVEITNLNLGAIGCSVIDRTCTPDFIDDEVWQNFNPKVGLTWAPRDDLNLYAHWTQGVRSGGYNFRNASAFGFPIDTTTGLPNPNFDPFFSPGPFDEETVNAFEVGFKAQPADGRATLNAAFYYNDINDMQRELNLADSITNSIVQTIINTADARILGFEAEGRVALTDQFLVTGFVGYTDGEYQEVIADISGDGLVNDTDLNLEIPRLSPWTYGAGFVFSQPLGERKSADVRFNYSHRDRNFYTDNNLGFLNAVDAIDASIALNMADNRVTFALYGQNLLNEVNFGGDSQLPPTLLGGTFSPLTRGRVVGIELRLKTN